MILSRRRLLKKTNSHGDGLLFVRKNHYNSSMSRATAFACLLTLFFGCKDPIVEGKAVDPVLLEFQRDHVSISHGKVGIGTHQSDATYVLLDVVNNFNGNVDLTLAGTLLDKKGEKVGQLRKQWLRLPGKGGRRTFALVDDQQQKREAAVFADIAVVKSTEAVYPLGVNIEEGNVFDDRGRVVVTGYVANKNDRNASAVVIASFYDKEGRILERPSTSVRVDRKQRRGIQFVGPDGSVSATLYIGEVLF